MFEPYGEYSGEAWAFAVLKVSCVEDPGVWGECNLPGADIVKAMAPIVGTIPRGWSGSLGVEGAVSTPCDVP